MGVEFGLVATDEELAAVQRLRYEVYVEEKGWFRDVADHQARRLVDAEDETGWIFYARDGDEMVGATRLSWGGNGFTDHQIEMYQLAPFLAEMPAEMLSVGERVTVRESHRGTSVVMDLMVQPEPMQAEHGVRLVFGGCEPHLFNLYVSLGQRPYARHHINSDEVGYVIPLVSFIPDDVPPAGYAVAQRVLEVSERATSATLTKPERYARDLTDALATMGAEHSPFTGMSEDGIKGWTDRGVLVRCDRGDVLLRRGGEARNMFVVIDGTFEVRDDDAVVGVLRPGEVFGEMAQLLDQARHFNVVATSDDARVLSLSGGALDRMLDTDPASAATFLLNLSQQLCRRQMASSPESPAMIAVS